LPSERSSSFLDVVGWVDLAPLSDGAQLPRTVAETLGLREASGDAVTAALIRVLRTRRSLLVFDNCEHLARACATLAKSLLSACPNLAILATSQVPLRTADEVVFPVPSLDTVNANPLMSVANLAQSGAVQLFIDRASMVLPGYALNQGNALTINRICQRLDGMPLAIELAASWIRVLAVSDILDQIEASLDILSSSLPTLESRHRSMHAVLESSWRRLNVEQQRVFAALAVFRGGFIREAAESVAETSLPILAALVENSLMQRLPGAGGTTRYTLHELVRQYALDHLEHVETDGAAEYVRQRHLDHFLAMAERAEQASCRSWQSQRCASLGHRPWAGHRIVAPKCGSLHALGLRDAVNRVWGGSPSFPVPALGRYRRGNYSSQGQSTECRRIRTCSGARLPARPPLF